MLQPTPIPLACALLLASCGSKTGLRVPDAGLDAATDAAPLDASPQEAAVPLCIEVVDATGPVTASLSLPVSLRAVDVMLVIDATASMEDEIENVRRRLVDRVIPGIREAIPDVELGVAFVGEFPVQPHGPSDVAPYALRAPVGTESLQLEGALEALPAWGNFDHPEAQIEGLFQVATGEGLPSFIDPALGCASGGLGGACFRRGAFSVIVLITDAPMHNGPPGIEPEAPYGFTPAPHGYTETLAVLRDRDIVVVGLGARDRGSPTPLPHLRQVALDTGAVDGSGQPLVFDIGASGTRTGDGLVEALTQLAAELPLDVTARVTDAPGDDVDAREWVAAIHPRAASPPSGARAITEDAFLGVDPGTEVTFELEVDARPLDSVPPGTRANATVVFETGRSLLGERDVILLAPGGPGCSAGVE